MSRCRKCSALGDLAPCDEHAYGDGHGDARAAMLAAVCFLATAIPVDPDADEAMDRAFAPFRPVLP